MSRSGGRHSHRYRWGGTRLVWLAVGFLVAAVVTGAGYGLVDGQSVAPRVVLDYSHADGALSVTHVAGDGFDGERVQFETADGRVLGRWGGERVTTGDSTRVAVPDGTAVRVVWVSSDGDRFVVSRWDG